MVWCAALPAHTITSLLLDPSGGRALLVDRPVLAQEKRAKPSPAQPEIIQVKTNECPSEIKRFN